MIADYLSRLETGEAPDQEYIDLPYVALFSIDKIPLDSESEDAWITEMMHFLCTGLPPDHLTLHAKKRLAVRSRSFCLFTDTLYHKRTDGIWRRAVGQFEKDAVLQEAHHDITGGHYVSEPTEKIK